MKFSFIVSAYNIENYIDKCIQSILSQSINDYEIIVIDDGSTDSTSEILKSFSGRNNIKIITQKNGGLGSTRNVGLKFATGEYIIFIDGDDWIESNYLEVVSNVLNNNNNPDIIRIGYFIDFDDRSIISNPVVEKDPSKIKKLVLNDQLSSQSWLNVAKKELYDNISFPTTLYEDLPVTFKIYFKASTIIIENTPIYHYIQRSTSISNSFSVKKPIGLLYGFKEKYDFAKANSLNDSCNMLFKKVIYNSIQTIRYLTITTNAKTDIKKYSAESIVFFKTNKRRFFYPLELFFSYHLTCIYILFVSNIIKKKRSKYGK